MSLKHTRLIGAGPVILAETVVSGKHKCARAEHIVSPADLGIAIEEDDE